MTAPNYVDAAEIKAVMPDVAFGTGYDMVLDSLAASASRLLDRITKRDPGAFATGSVGAVRYFDGSGNGELWIGEIAAAPSKVAVDEAGTGVYTEWASTDYIVWPYNSAPYTRLTIDYLHGTKAIWPTFPKAVRITAPWGFSTAVPDDLKQALVVQCVRWFKRGQQGFSDVGAIAELGQLRYVEKLDPDIETIVFGGGYGQVTI